MLGADGMKQLQKLLKSGNGESDSEDESEALRTGGAQQLGNIRYIVGSVCSAFPTQLDYYAVF